MRVIGLLLLLMISLGSISCANLNRAPEIRITVHAEGQEGETEQFVREVETEYGTKYFRRSAELSQRDVVSVDTVDVDGVNVAGLKLSPEAGRRLYNLTLTRRGRGQVLMVLVNAVPRDFLPINGVVEDGVLVIWSGMTEEEVTALEEEIAYRNRYRS